MEDYNEQYETLLKELEDINSRRLLIFEQIKADIQLYQNELIVIEQKIADFFCNYCDVNKKHDYMMVSRKNLVPTGFLNRGKYYADVTLKCKICGHEKIENTIIQFNFINPKYERIVPEDAFSDNYAHNGVTLKDLSAEREEIKSKLDNLWEYYTKINSMIISFHESQQPRLK